MNEHFIINLGRQLGSGGREIGQKLAKEFGIEYYDKELIQLAAEESGLCEEIFERADERAQQSFMGSLIGNRFPFIGEGNMAFNNFLTHDSLFKIQSDVIRKLATEHSCLFVGRCADYILRDFPNCVNVFISAPKEFRIKRVCEMYKVKEEEAAKLIEDADKKRAIYYNYYSYKKWGAAATYHLCIDSSVLGIDKTVEFISDFVKAKISTPKE
ncbi:MAG: cytidylate kinase-like family protein [Phocaeicola sp.]|nr:cytidylate kinase-like family protein [Phocaeicola sp.]